MLTVCAIRDRAVDAYLTPFFSQSESAAVRSFGDLVQDPQCPMNKHPEDYELFVLGVFNERDAQCLLEARPRSLSAGPTHVSQQ